MTLKNLAQRYEQRVNQLYAGATLKFENGKPSKGFNDDPLNVRKVGEESFGKTSRVLGRLLPTIRAGQDTVRLTKFLASVRGLTFLAKQQLLQTGNTFEYTRLINPVFALAAAAAPAIGNIVRVRRHLNPANNLLARTDTSYPTVKKLGQLQKSTYDKNFLIGANTKLSFSDFKPGQFLNTIQNIGVEQPWDKSRPELKAYIVTINNKNVSVPFLHGGIVTKLNKYGIRTGNEFNPSKPAEAYLTYYNATYGWDNDPTLAHTRITSDYKAPYLFTNLPDGAQLNTKAKTSLLSPDASASALITNTGIVGSTFNLLGRQTTAYQSKTDLSFIKYFTPGILAIKNRSDSTEPRKGTDTARPISYIKDPANITGSVPLATLSRYQNLPAEIDDPITVSFAMGSNQAVPFRAFIKDINHTINPEYKTNQYIGRIEKFVNYVSVQRELSFKLGVIAFSKDELEVVWTRINYLTGMAFPHSLYRGIFQPNIIKLTIGNLFNDQYGYITSLSTNFTDISETWDIDAKVPIGATMDIKFSIIEKRAMTANSPFYAINE